MWERSTSEQQALFSAIIEEAGEWEQRIINKSFFTGTHRRPKLQLSDDHLANKSHGEIITICTRISTTALGLLHKRSPRLHNARSEKRKIQAQNDRAAINPTQNPKHTYYSFISIRYQLNPHHETDAKPHLAPVVLKFIDAKWQCGPRRGTVACVKVTSTRRAHGLVSKGGRVTKLVYKGRVSRWMCTRAVRNVKMEIFEANCGLASVSRWRLSL